MPSFDNRIPGQTSLSRKQKKEQRIAKLEVSDLPNWMFWEKSKIDAYIDNIDSLADVKNALKHMGAFIRISVRLHGKYEERE